MTQQANPANSWVPDKVVRKKLPLGEKGIRYSLEQVAAKAAEGRSNPSVRAWATRTLRDSGKRPSTPLERTTILLDAFREQFLWIPDPDRVEFMAGAHLLFEKIFGGGDCDDLTIAFLAALLSAVSSVGVHVAVVGHAYDNTRDIMHVLGAVWIDNKWWYIDPSYPKFKFGDCAPYTRERIIEVPSQKLLCDATVCLRGEYAKPPAPNRSPGEYVGVDGIGDLSMMPDLNHSVVFDSQMLGADPSPSLTPPAPVVPTPPVPASNVDPSLQKALLYLEPAWKRFFYELKTNVDQSWSNSLKAYRGMMRTAAAAGIVLPDPPPQEGTSKTPSFGWTAQSEQQMVNLQAIVQRASAILQDVVDGKRVVVATPDKKDLLIEALPSDFVYLGTTREGVPYLYDPASGAPVKTEGNIALGLNPWLVGAIGASVMGVLVAYNTDSICKAFEVGCLSVTKTIQTWKMADLIESGHVTPEQAQETLKVIDAGLEPLVKLAQQKPPEDSWPLAAKVGVGVVVVGGLALAAKYFKVF